MTDRPDPAEWIAKRRELLAAATEGPWEADGTEISQHWSRPEPWKPVASNEVACMAYCYGGSGRGIEREDDANLIADARTSLSAVLEALEAVLEVSQSALEDAAQMKAQRTEERDAGTYRFWVGMEYHAERTIRVITRALRVDS